MNITMKWLKENGACSEGIQWFLEQKKHNSFRILNALIEDGKLDWANWFIVRIMKRKEYLSYAIFAAEQVIDIFEKEYPEENHPREAINAAKRVLINDTEKNRAASAESAKNAENAAWAASVAWAASAKSAESAVWAASAESAESAANAAWAASAESATWAASAASVTGAEMQLKILNYGIKILKEGLM